MSCPVVKNEFYELNITALGAGGEGIGRIDGYTLFVDGAIPGDVIRMKAIKVKKKYGVGRLVEFIETSKDRVEPICPVAKQCGGCTLQHMSYDAQLAYKQNLIKEALVRIGGLEEEEVLIKMESIMGQEVPYYYRNKVQYPVRQTEAGLQIGFYAKRSHRIIESKRCYIQDTYNETIVEAIREWMIDYRIQGYVEESNTGLIRHIMIRKSTDQGKFQVVLVSRTRKVPHIDALATVLSQFEHVISFSLNINPDKTNVVLGSEMISIFGDTHLKDSIGDIQYNISPLSFFQVNGEQTSKLYNKALEYAALSGNETIYDLYCGIGSISLFLAKKAKKVYGVEIVEAAIEDAKGNAKMNGIKNVEFFAGKAEVVMPKLYKEQGIVADLVVVDPPRKGCDETLLETIVEMSPKRLVYVSCDPSTLARDIKYLKTEGYQLDKVCGCDMFGHTTHVETVLSMVKK